MALVAGGADPSVLIDKDGNSMLHNADTVEEITALLELRLIDVDATNKVPSFFVDLLLFSDIRSVMHAVGSPPFHTLDYS